MVEQTIKKVVTVNAGTVGSVSIPIPSGYKAFLKGYGYTWYDDTTYTLNTGNITLPSRTDQEGSASIPRIFDDAYPIRSGGEVKLTINNAGASNNDYEVVFYIKSDQLLEGDAYNSDGGELAISTTAATGSSVTTLTSSVTALENVEVAQASAVGTVKILPIAGSDGTNYYRVKTDSAGNLVTTAVDPRYPNEEHVSNTASVPTTSYVDKAITLTGTNRVIKEVYIYLPDGGGDQAKVELYDGAPTTTKIAEFYYRARSFILLRSSAAITNNLYLRIYGESGSAQTAYIDVVYDHD